MSTRDQSLVMTVAAAEPTPARVHSDAARSDAEDGGAAVWLSLLVMVALSVRLLVIVLGPATAMERALTPETLSHLAAGEVLVGETVGRDLAVDPAVAAAEHLGLARTADGRNVLVGPIYPWLLGASDEAGLPRHAVMLAQCLLSGALVLLVFAVARPLLNRTDAAVLAAAIVAVHPALITGSIALAPGAWAAAAVLAGLAAVLNWPGARSAVVGGALLGCAPLIVPATLWVGPVVALWLPMYRRTWKSVAVAGALLVSAAAPPGLWMMRNAEAAAGPRLSSDPVAALALDLAPRVTGQPIDLGVTGEAVALHDRLQSAATQSLSDLRSDLPTTLEQLAQRGRDTLVRSDIAPLYALLGLSVDPIDPMQAIRTGDYLMTRQADPAGARLALGLLAVDTALLGAAIAGVGLLGWRRHRADAALLVALMLGCCVAASLTLWPDNLRLLAMPCLALLACAPLASVRPRPARAARPRRSSRARHAASFDIAVEDLAPEPAVRTGRPI